MRPRPFGRGNSDLNRMLEYDDGELQWGRGLSAAETAFVEQRIEAGLDVLQWGRGLSAAETYSRQPIPAD